MEASGKPKWIVPKGLREFGKNPQVKKHVCQCNCKEKARRAAEREAKKLAAPPKRTTGGRPRSYDYPADYVPEGGQPGKCNARKRNAKGKTPYCTRVAGYGTKHLGLGRCKYHGGKTLGHAIQAQKILLEKALRTYGIPVVGITPEEALLGELERTAGAVQWLEERIGTMQPESLVWGRHQAKQLGARQLVDEDERAEIIADMGRDLYEITEQAGLSAWVQLYLKERMHLTKIAAIAIKAGLEERKINLAERQGSQLRVVLTTVFAELQLTDAQMQRVPEILAGVLEKFTKGKVVEGQYSLHQPQQVTAR